MPQKQMQSSKSPAENQPLDEPGIASSGLGAPPVSHGKLINPVLPEDDLTVEEAVEQGMDDAEEDSATKASRSDTSAQG
jgi:hypothetical protein